MLPWIKEHRFLQMGHDLKDIRSWDSFDFEMHYRLSELFEFHEKEFELRLSGADMSGKKKSLSEKDFINSPKSSIKRFDPEIGDFR